MTDTDQKQLGKTLWNIADQLRGAMNADDFRDYMLSFLFLRYLSDNYETAAKKELGQDYPDAVGARRPHACRWRSGMRTTRTTSPSSRSRCAARCITSSSPRTSGTASPTWPAPRTANCSNTLQAGFKYIENESFESTFQGLFSEINLGSDKLGKTLRRPERQALHHHPEDRRRAGANSPPNIDALGDAYEYLIGQFAAGSGKKAGEFYTPQQISDILSAIVTLDSQEPAHRHEEAAGERVGLRLRLRLPAPQRAQAHGSRTASARSTGRKRTSPPTTSPA